MTSMHPMHPLQEKRRRRRTLQKEGEGESSREASAESNDEMPSGLEEDDTASLSAASIGGPSLSTRESFEATTIPSFASANSKHGKRPLSAALPTSSLAHKTPIETDGEGEISEGSAGRMLSHFLFAVTKYELTPNLADDGDISSTNAPAHKSPTHPHQHGHLHGTPRPNNLPSLQPGSTSTQSASSSPRLSSHGGGGPPSRHPGHGGDGAPPAWAAAPQGFLSNMKAEDIQDHIKVAIAGDPGRAYRIKEPPTDRPVRVYADGVYDLLHYGHMLQLRQCKLAFPSVHLMVGVCSDELVRKHKATPVLTSVERYESVRHCKWTDEVIEDAPWEVDEAFFKKHKIDYVAHDEEPYVSAGKNDVYAYAKSIGAFLPTKRTNGVSTSELLQRIVEGYREGDYDSKFVKLGLPELCSNAGTRNGSENGTHGSKVGEMLDVATAVDGHEDRDVPMEPVAEDATMDA